MFVVVAYDIANDRRRMRVHALLLRYGTAVQESVFECVLIARDLRRLRARLQATVHPRHDSVRIYRLCRDCVTSIDVVAGARPKPSPSVVVV